MFDCNCGRNNNTEAGLKQHQRRYCRYVEGATEDGATAENRCKHCQRTFSSFSGLCQHERLAHPVQYNAELEQEAAGAREPWSVNEISIMAALEIDYEGPNINQYLGRVLGRDHSQVKNQRRKNEYKSLVERWHREREEAAALDHEEIVEPHLPFLVDCELGRFSPPNRRPSVSRGWRRGCGSWRGI